jgi:hypothetical protein
LQARIDAEDAHRLEYRQPTRRGKQSCAFL